MTELIEDDFIDLSEMSEAQKQRYYDDLREEEDAEESTNYDEPKKKYRSSSKKVPMKQRLLMRLIGFDDNNEEIDKNKPVQGIDQLPGMFAEECKRNKHWKEPGQEHRAISDIMWMYQKWMKATLPTLSFEDAIEFCEAQSNARIVKEKMSLTRSLKMSETSIPEADDGLFDYLHSEDIQEVDLEQDSNQDIQKPRVRTRSSGSNDNSGGEEEQIVFDLTDEEEETLQPSMNLDEMFSKDKRKRIKPTSQPAKKRKLTRKRVEESDDDDN
ncbi:DapD [Acrasis kona]|uniref:DapD n=1 Tax=Acrasis kona TaxID=1008807 RepID=A0AAW2ZE39_9EUKA